MNMRARQKGTTLLELLIVLLIMTSVILGAAALVDNYTQNLRVSLAAQHMSQFGNAVQAYIKDYYTYVQPNAKPTVSCVITFTDLMTDPVLGTPTTKYLPANFNPTNSYGQDISALVLQPGTAVPPGSGMLTALVVTEIAKTDPSGKPINDVDLGQLAGLIGAAGGGIYTSTPSAAAALNQAVGTMGKWRFDITSDAVGQYFSKSASHCSTGAAVPNVTLKPGIPLMALWFSSDTSSAYLYRNQVPGLPDLNKMVTNLEFDPSRNSTMKLNNITVLGNLGIPKQVEVGDPCGQSQATTPNTAIDLGTVAADSIGRVLSCQNVVNGGIGDPVTVKLWQVQASLYWGEPVDTYNDLAGNLLLLKPGIPCNPTTATQWQTRIVKYPTVGSGPRAYTCNPLGTNPAYPSHWEPLAADDQGILTLGTAQSESGGCFNKGMMSMNNAGILMSCQTNPSFPLLNMWVAVGSSSAHYRFTIMGYIDWNKDRMVGTGVMKTSGGVSTFTGTLWCDPTLAAPVASQGQEYPQPGGGTVPHQACGSGGTWELPNPSPLIAYQAALGRLPTVIWDEYGYSSAPLLVSVADLPVFYYEKVW